MPSSNGNTSPRTKYKLFITKYFVLFTTNTKKKIILEMLDNWGGFLRISAYFPLLSI